MDEAVRPLPIGDVPAGPALLMQVIKHYERLTVRAVAERSRRWPWTRLMAHRWCSRIRGRAPGGRLSDAHAPYVGDWA